MATSSLVQEHYAKFVAGGGDGPSVYEGRAAGLGYAGSLVGIPARLRGDPRLWEASCGSGCPPALLFEELQNAEKDGSGLVIMDIGCGAGHDALLAANRLGSSDRANGFRVIGIDLTPEMIGAANRNKERLAAENSAAAEFLVQSIEDPSPEFLERFEGKVDYLISNGVFNLIKNKPQAFRNARRLLKPGTGRFLFSDVVKMEKDDPDAKLMKTSIADGNNAFSQ